jgi:hypothetical protein
MERGNAQPSVNRRPGSGREDQIEHDVPEMGTEYARHIARQSAANHGLWISFDVEVPGEKIDERAHLGRNKAMAGEHGMDFAGPSGPLRQDPHQQPCIHLILAHIGEQLIDHVSESRFSGVDCATRSARNLRRSSLWAFRRDRRMLRRPLNHSKVRDYRSILGMWCADLWAFAYALVAYGCFQDSERAVQQRRESTTQSYTTLGGK